MPQKKPDRDAPTTKKPQGKRGRGTTKKASLKNTKKETTKSTPKTKRKPQAKCGSCQKVKRWCKCGRPSKLHYTTVGKLCEMFRVDCTIEEACSQAGIHRDTYNDRYNNKREFSDKNGEKKIFTMEVDNARAFPKMLARQTVLKNIQKGDGKLGMEYLRRRDERFRDKAENTINLGTVIDENDLLDD